MPLPSRMTFRRKREGLDMKAPLGVLIGLCLGACAAAMPGYVPEGSKRTGFDRAKPFDSGQVAGDGVYVPSAAERDLTCGKLRGSMRIIATRLVAASKPEPSGLSSAAQSAVAGVRGKPLILPASEEARRERARFDGYNKLLAEKNCPTTTIEAEVAASGSLPAQQTAKPMQP